MGDFYEMFFEDAHTASRILGIALTARGMLEGQKVPMCGVPHHASRSYIARLVESGLKVAICEQVEGSGEGPGLVRRDVVRVVTAGSSADERDVERGTNLYMAAVVTGGGRFGLAHADLSTGEFRVTEMTDPGELLGELGRLAPAEVVIPEGDPFLQREEIAQYRVEKLGRDAFDPRSAERLLKEQLGVASLSAFGCEAMPQAVVAAGSLVRYIAETQKTQPAHIKNLASYRVGDFMVIDEATCSHLELLRTLRRQSEEGTLFQVLNHTVTSMGGRLLRKWILYPLLHTREIRRRLAAVQCLKEDGILRETLRNTLKEVHDLERLSGRIAMGRANARDLNALRASIVRLPAVRAHLTGSVSELLGEIAERIDPLQEVADRIGEAIHEDPPISIKEGGIIRAGYDAELDRIVSLSRDGKSWIQQFARGEVERTGISSLKVGYNKIFGYYIEISKANLHLVPADYIRKQTLVNGERYVTEALKDMEEQILGAEERRVALEYTLFDEVRKWVADRSRRILATAGLVAEVDVLCGLAEAAARNDYVCPEVNDGCGLEIREGRHPVIEQTVKQEGFVPNDILLDDHEQQLLIITGPNMAGKSTILRQTALTVILAQMGSFVPAGAAKIGIVDRVFTRVGASDDLARGLSTFMVEMNETAHILRHATPASLIVLDEIGRGTSTYDGLSIAWAVAEALHDLGGRGARTLFATHYHELTELAAAKPRVKNHHVAVREWKDQVIFLRKLVPGGTSRSYGIQVARIAGLPGPVLERAKEILKTLEGSELGRVGKPRFTSSAPSRRKEEIQAQLMLFASESPKLRDWIAGLDIATMTPLDALLELNKMKTYVEGLE
jgi:DNA mismatch repair protein MutS